MVGRIIGTSGIRFHILHNEKQSMTKLEEKIATELIYTKINETNEQKAKRIADAISSEIKDVAGKYAKYTGTLVPSNLRGIHEWYEDYRKQQSI